MKDTYEIYNVCPFCATTHFVEVPKAEYHRWRYGELIQNAMPSLSSLERDQLITGTCPDCLKMVFGDY